MGWFDGWFGSGGSDPDPLRRLDPKLREFFEKESPVKYTTAENQQQQQQQQQRPQPQHQQQQRQRQQTPQQTLTPSPDQQQPSVPRESLYQDGRYAHLWKTYRPLASVEAETKSDHERLTDVLEAYKERRAQIGRAALENCADEQLAWNECMKSGSWTARMTMCRAEVQRFERCYNAQSRLLKALGYLSVHGRSAAVDEDIQMRADALYQRMVAQEREIERAREEGREAPVFPSVFEGKEAAVAAAAAAAAIPGEGKDDRRFEPNAATLALWKEKLEKLPAEERAAEEAALRAEHRAKVEMATRLQGLWQEQAKEREARKEKGQETIFDKFRSVVPGPWSGPKSE
ncbi:Autophagy-related protein 6 [Madurella fahalii]|uniref:Autophagy-related protein 6 n=1 Tax=Madurella fahalii TaxID=1157608 RepID=A0ABQ0FYM3_9PEZI